MKKSKITFVSMLLVVSMVLCAAVPGGLINMKKAKAADGLSDNHTSAPEAWGPVPSEGQLYYHKQEMAAFVHYGINAFTNQEWGSSDYKASQFNIRNADGSGGGSVDADQWVSVLKDAGFKRLILVAKHHDGFCFWPTKTTTHNVSNAPSNDDIVLKVSEACRSHDMDMGIYLSPWDMKADQEGNFGATYTAADAGSHTELIGKPNIDKYNNYYMTQLKELLGNPEYGGKDNRFVEIWMDGAKGWGKAQDYYFTDFHRDYWVDKYGLPYDPDRRSWRDVIHSEYNGHENENIVILAPYGDEVRWIGNEGGTAGVPCWSRINWDDQRDKFLRDNGENGDLQNHGDPNGVDWSVPETNTPIYDGGKWFFAGNSDGSPRWQPKSIRELARVYFDSVGRGTVLLLNASPGTDGKIDEAQAERFRQFGEDIRETFKKNLAKNATVNASSVRGNDIAFSPDNVLDDDYDTYWTMNDGQTTGTLTVDFDGEKTFDVVSIQEYIPLGQRISKYNVEAYYNGGWHVFGNENNCQTIGYKALVRGDITKATSIRINIKASQAVPLINSVGVYKAAPDFELNERINVPYDAEFIDDNDDAFSYDGDWNMAYDNEYENGTVSVSQSNGKENSVSFDFTGNRFYIVGNNRSQAGEITVEVDGKDAITWDISGSSSSKKDVLYASPNMAYGDHTVTIKTFDEIGFDGVYISDLGDKPVFSFEAEEYDVSKESPGIVIKVLREGAINTTSSVHFTTSPGSAVHGEVYETTDMDVVFAPGETVKKVKIKLFGTLKGEARKYFYIKLSVPDEDEALFGAYQSAKIMVTDVDLMENISEKIIPVMDSNVQLWKGETLRNYGASPVIKLLSVTGSALTSDGGEFGEAFTPGIENKDAKIGFVKYNLKQYIDKDITSAKLILSYQQKQMGGSGRDTVIAVKAGNDWVEGSGAESNEILLSDPSQGITWEFMPELQMDNKMYSNEFNVDTGESYDENVPDGKVVIDVTDCISDITKEDPFVSFALFERLGAQITFASKEGANKSVNTSPVIEITTKYTPPVYTYEEDDDIVSPGNKTDTGNTNPSVNPIGDKKTSDVTGTDGSVKVKKAAIKKIKKTSKTSVKITWKKVKGVSGYQISYTDKTKFKKAKSKNVSRKKTSVVIKKLKSKKTYRFRIRAYKKSNGKKVYGKYSAVKKIKL